VSSDAVPLGLVWVLRSISVAISGDILKNAGGFAFLDQSGYPIFGRTDSSCTADTWFYWEGRQVIDPGQVIQLVTSSTPMIWRVSGFALTLP